MSTTNEVEDFIERRFSKNCEFTTGNCYWFAVILTTRFPKLKIYYDTIKGHFLAVDILDGTAYDFYGKHSLSDYKSIIAWDILSREDLAWYNRIYRDCIQ